MPNRLKSTCKPWAPEWASSSIFYQIFPFGFLGCPFCNPCIKGDQYLPDETLTPSLKMIRQHYDHLVDLGIDAVYFSPVFESESHGYDTIDYLKIDRRLGDENLFGEIVDELHSRGIRVVLDGVFNHASRHHFAFADLRKNLENSPYRDWFKGIDFSKSGEFGYGFDHHGWEGYKKLVEWNLDNPEIENHLLEAASYWTKQVGVDGWRLDVAYCVEPVFWEKFRKRVKTANPDCFLVGEIDHGNLRKWVNPSGLDSATNYHLYKAMYTAFQQTNLSGLGHALSRIFHPGHGLYAEIPLFNFLSNHDVPRIASWVDDPKSLRLALLLLFTIPGIPCLYYGDEFGTKGMKTWGDLDQDLRRMIPSSRSDWPTGGEDLFLYVKKLVNTRKNHPALSKGNLAIEHCSKDQLIYSLRNNKEWLIVGMNLSDKSYEWNFQPTEEVPTHWKELLTGSSIPTSDGTLSFELEPGSGMILFASNS